MVVGCIYRHPCMQHIEFNDEYLKPLSENLISEKKEVILCGDFNIDLQREHQQETFITFSAFWSLRGECVCVCVCVCVDGGWGRGG